MAFGSPSMLLLLQLLPIGVSIHAVILNYHNPARAGRKAFFLALAAISIVPLLFVYDDLARLFHLPPLAFNLRPAVVQLSWAALAYPFYERQRRRIADAGFSKHLAWLGLVPYLNYLFFVFLCLTPSRPDPGPDRTVAKVFD